MALFNPWEILLAWIPNSDGTPPPDKHRCVYLQDSAKVAGAVLVLGITSNEAEFKAGYSVELPYLDAPGGHPVTHLTKRSFVQTEWHEHILPEVVSDVVGYVAEEHQALIKAALRRRIDDLKRGRAAN